MEDFSLQDIKENAHKLSSYIVKTPILSGDVFLDNPHQDESVILKMELFQKTGTFKLRGALTRISNLDQDEKDRGIVAGTGGNHGVAVAYAARLENVSAKIIIPNTINSYRKDLIESYGVEVIQATTICDVFEIMEEIAKTEGRVVIHPFEHPMTTLGTATLGYEFIEQVPDLDILIVAIGGGGLASGVAMAAKKIKPDIKVYGVEPTRAPSMYLSLREGKPITLDTPPVSIADSLCSPCALPYSFEMCRRYLDDVVLVEDSQMIQAMKELFEKQKIASEPAGAAALAALKGPLKQQCIGKKVGLIVCGSNIDVHKFYEIVSQGNLQQRTEQK